MKREEIVRELQQYKETGPMRLLKELLASDLRSLREKNDSAKADEVLRNQGAIVWLKKVLRDLSTEKTDRAVFDGGFGE